MRAGYRFGVWRILAFFVAAGIFWQFFVTSGVFCVWRILAFFMASGVFWPFLWRLAYLAPTKPLPKIKEMHYGGLKKGKTVVAEGGAFIKHGRV